MKPAASLRLFQTYADRDAYTRATGEQAPPFDASRAPKLWKDPAATAALMQNAVYERLPVPGEPLALVSFALPVHVAGEVNLPDRYLYPVYQPAPVQAMMGSSPAANATEFCTLQQAVLMQALLGGTGLRQANFDVGGESVTYGPTEQRRRWAFTVAGAEVIAGRVLADSYSHGIGAPGHFTRADNGTVGEWIPDASVVNAQAWSNNLEPVPEPVRALAAGESLVRAGLELSLFVATANESSDGSPGQTAALPAHFEADFATLCHDIAAIKAALGKAGLL